MKFKHGYTEGKYSVVKMTCKVAAEDKYFRTNPYDNADSDLYARICTQDILPYFLFKKYTKSNSVRVAFATTYTNADFARKVYEGEKCFIRTHTCGDRYDGECFFSCEAMFLVDGNGNVLDIYAPGYEEVPVPDDYDY